MIMINTQIPLNESHLPGMDVLYDNHVKHPYKHSRDYLLLLHILIYHWLENMLTWY